MRFVIFDFDGTLVDTGRAIQHSIEALCRKCGLMAPPAAVVQRLVGLPLETTLAELRRGPGDAPPIEELKRIYREEYRLVADALSAPYPEIPALLDQLATRGVALGLATSKGSAAIASALEAYGWSSHFTSVETADSTLNAKPHPEMVLKQISRLGFAREAVLVVGDATYDLLMARAAGVRACGVSYGMQSAELLATAEPAYLVHTVADLSELLLRLSDATPCTS